jgi:hypothetical protein
MKLKFPFSKTCIVCCPDGTTRIVYKDIDKAFPLCIPGWQGKIGATLDAVKGAPVQLTADYQTKIQGLLYSLDELNQSLMMTFRAVYIAYQSNPCKNSDFLNRQIEKMIQEHNRLTSLRVQIRGLITLAEINSNHPELVVPVFQSIVNQLGGQSVSVAASMEIQEARKEMKLFEGEGGQHAC